MNIKQLQAYYGLKWNPFLAEVPNEALVRDDSTKRLCWRIEHVVMDGGFAMITGEPGAGKSIALRQLHAHLSEIPELTVRVLSRPQSHIRDFYREMGDVFGVDLKLGNRFGSFTALRTQWLSHIKSSMFRPVLLLDEAQETPDEVLSELRLLSSVNLDSKTILAVVPAGDSRLPNKLRSTALLPLESRIRVRHHLDKRPQDEMAHILSELLIHAGAETLLTPGVIKTMAEHAMGNLRAMMMMGNELLAAGAQRQTRLLDEGLFFEVFKESIKKKRGGK
jgi:general secretion pathway protein A